VRKTFEEFWEEKWAMAEETYEVCVVVVRKSELDNVYDTKYWVSSQADEATADCVAQQSAYLLTTLKNFVTLA
jgi:hypothetical protein